MQDGGMSAKNLVLVIDDEADIRELLGMTLTRMGLDAHCAATATEGIALLEQNSYDLCLTDMRLPDGDGLAILDHVAKHHPSVPVAVITAHGSTENAVAALKAGAFDYLAKPVSLDQLRTLVRSALKLPRPGQGRRMNDGHEAAPGNPVLIGDSALMQATRQMIDRLARTQAPIHVTGESGSGKELAARLIHLKGSRRDAPFVAVNCGAIPENLMESEFFGYRKGAFTGATADRDGFFQAANGGTLFLDEVADLPLLMQVKLLRAIQEKKVRKVGSTGEEQVDVRIISATHRNLGEEVRSGAFRQDLYYRLNVIDLRMPGLREMPEDIPLLAAAILGRQCGGEVPAHLSQAALKELQGYAFPGNVRELENVLERALALTTGDEIRREDLQLAPVDAAGEAPDVSGLPLQERLDFVEKQAILDALEQTHYNRTAAAKLLGITFRALRYRMERLGIQDELDSKG
ncbi:MAG: sigma-54-dependent Fis family transcriptional regulator [Betaproteobacteria bacterium RIFCSPLOWO2_12_FULL_62_13]|nr:MAG: sigma-54-dependent Fis family transcriptional regulator [Betaproteobacteria bacterium RIFCSPLOWO2_12_FULL_62_13]